MQPSADSSPTFVFDGDCGFCTSSAHWIEHRLPAGTARFAPWQRLDLDELGLTPADLEAAAFWVEPGGRRQRGHRAIGAALATAPGFWGLAGRAILVPPLSWLARPVYALIARNRHRMPGGTPACKL